MDVVSCAVGLDDPDLVLRRNRERQQKRCAQYENGRPSLTGLHLH
jgi:hypothetical protein